MAEGRNTDNRKFRILLAPTRELAESVRAEASIEAEYGDYCVEGTKVTLAHHGSRSKNPAPCNAEVDPIPGGTILVSHLDLDTIGGIMAVQGRRPEDPEFWKAAEFIDVNGTHHIRELPQDMQDKLNAYYAHEFSLRKKEGPPSRAEIADITEAAEKRISAVEAIIDERHPDHDRLIRDGRDWAERTEEAVEKQFAFETDRVRVFVTTGPFTSASYRSPETGKIFPATVTLNMNTKAVTVAFEDGGNPEKSAVKIVHALWGPEAGGHNGIAGSPRGQEMGAEELIEAVMKVEETIAPPLTPERAEELPDIREQLTEAVRENMRERGLEFPDKGDGPQGPEHP